MLFNLMLPTRGKKKTQNQKQGDIRRIEMSSNPGRSLVQWNSQTLKLMMALSGLGIYLYGLRGAKRKDESDWKNSELCRFVIKAYPILSKIRFGTTVLVGEVLREVKIHQKGKHISPNALYGRGDVCFRNTKMEWSGKCKEEMEFLFKNLP